MEGKSIKKYISCSFSFKQSNYCREKEGITIKFVQRNSRLDTTIKITFQTGEQIFA